MLLEIPNTAEWLALELGSDVLANWREGESVLHSD